MKSLNDRIAPCCDLRIFIVYIYISFMMRFKHARGTSATLAIMYCTSHMINASFCLVDCCQLSLWWRHQMETFSTLLALCTGNSLVTGEFPAQRASKVELWCFIWSASEQTVEYTIVDLRRNRAHFYVTVMLGGSYDAAVQAPRNVQQMLPSNMKNLRYNYNLFALSISLCT